LNRSAETQRTIRVTLRCDLVEVRPKVERVRKFLLKAGFKKGSALDCELALVEACTNAIQHVSNGGRRYPVLVEVKMGNGEAEFRVTDHTTGFRWPKRPTLPDASSEGGRGVFLIHSLMDSAEYVRGSDGNVLILRKAV
jgi:serine/threonine-protein kinase RsbW